MKRLLGLLKGILLILKIKYSKVEEIIEISTPEKQIPFDIILQCYDHASIRLACKYMLKNLSGCETGEELNSNVSSIDFLPDELDEVSEKMKFRGYSTLGGNQVIEGGSDEEEELVGLA